MTTERNLILVHSANTGELGDFREIAQAINELASDIEVFIVSSIIPLSTTRERASHRPTLIFSIGSLVNFRPLRGKIYAASPIPKLKQIARFEAAGLPVPPTIEITPNIELPESRFGSHVVVKPQASEASAGDFIKLKRREAVRYQSRESFPEDHPGRHGPMLAQRFIDTGPLVSHYRVLTLFGSPLFALKTSSRTPMPPLDSPEDVLATITLAAGRPRRQDGSIARELTWDADILELARRTYSALPEVALQGVDIIREAVSEKLYVLEANPDGNIWIFSRREMTERLKRVLGVERLTDQFDAFRTAAKVLVERTRVEAE